MLKNLDKFNLPEVEEKVLKFWKKNRIFEKIEKGKGGKKEFIFYEGPPTANGRPGTHHVLARVFKDIILRYKTMRGYSVLRRAGWDTQGLPVEIEVEKELDLKNKQDIEEFGVAEFNKRARSSVWKYKDEWEKLTERIGFWLDFDNAYVTYKNKYLEKLWWVFKEIDKRKLLKKFYKVVPFCMRCQTTLSSHELGQPGVYREVKDPSIYIKFEIIDSHLRGNDKGGGNDKEYLLVWTTTPWTLPANIAVAINPKLEYKKYKVTDSRLPTGQAGLPTSYFIWSANKPPEIEGAQIEMVSKVKGKKMVGLEYKPLYKNKGPHKVYVADFVEANEGTGIVHLAPFGGDDLELMKKKMKQEDMPITVDERGRVAKGFPGAGKFIKDADKDILEDLNKRELLYYQTIIEHEYPFCWRCSHLLIYYPRLSWFIEVSKLRENLSRVNKKINWIPDYVKEGRFGNWIKEAKDWAISRERYWGTPLPIWECGSCNNYLVVGGLDDLNKYAYVGRAHKSSVDNFPLNDEGELDLHRPFIDKIYLKCPKCAKKMKRVPEVADVWFDSGAMPFAGGYYPKQFPADYICEAMDQTRGWFYTLLAISVLLKKEEPYRNVISLGLIVDKHGRKMSKSKGNVIDPWDLINNRGVDALRWYFYTLNQPGDVKKVDEADVGKVLRRVILMFYNSYKFYETYATVNSKQKFDAIHILDKWILARYNEAVKKTTKHLDKYHIYEAARELEILIDDLSRWYIRRSRKRFQQPIDGDWERASAVLHFVLLGVAKLIAPFMPFVAESVYQSLLEGNLLKDSIHLADWPKLKIKNVDKKLLEQMAEVRRLASLVLAERADVKIKVRQPLALLKIKNQKSKIKIEEELLKILAEEINVKKIKYDSKLKEEIKLDTKITATLKKEGQLRDLARIVQGLRQDAGLKPGDKMRLFMKMPKNLEMIVGNSKSFLRDVGAEKIEFKKYEKVSVKLDTKLEGERLWLGISSL